MTFRLAAYAVCVKDDSVLLARCVPPQGEPLWTLPGGGVEHGEDPYDAVVREVEEETGCVGVFYAVRITGGEVAESVWTPFPEVTRLRRSSLVDVGIALARTLPATGHTTPVRVGGLIRH